MATPFSQQFPDLYKQWVAAGGPEDNFKAHVLAVNPPGLVATAADVGWMLSHTNGSLNQLADVVKHVGGASGFPLKALVVGQSP